MALQKQKWEVIPPFFAKDGGLMEMACFSHTHCNICMCVCVFILQKICSSQAQKRDSSKLNACYHKPWLQQCLSSGPSPDATCIYSTLALHDGRKICLATRHGKKMSYLTKQTAIYISKNVDLPWALSPQGTRHR